MSNEILLTRLIEARTMSKNPQYCLKTQAMLDSIIHYVKAEKRDRVFDRNEVREFKRIAWDAYYQGRDNENFDKVQAWFREMFKPYEKVVKERKG